MVGYEAVGRWERKRKEDLNSLNLHLLKPSGSLFFHSASQRTLLSLLFISSDPIRFFFLTPFPRSTRKDFSTTTILFSSLSLSSASIYHFCRLLYIPNPRLLLRNRPYVCEKSKPGCLYQRPLRCLRNNLVFFCCCCFFKKCMHTYHVSVMSTHLCVRVH